MNYKVAIDPGHGGSDIGFSGNGLVEKDYSLLISNYIKERLDDLGISNIITRNTDRNLTDEERVSVIESLYGNDNNVIVISNHLNKGGESGLEIVYSLKKNDSLAKEITNQVENNGGIVNKYYQLRDPNNTANDYYSIIRDTPNYNTVLIAYGYVDNKDDANRISKDYLNYAEAVVKAIAKYTGKNYVPNVDNYYVVQKGDTLYQIANKYGITVNELKSFNNLSSNLLDIGQIILIPNFSSNNSVYVVKSGDTLYKIANAYGITVDSLKKENNLNSNFLSIGQILKIPSGSSKKYTVKSGDTLYKIASIYGVSVDAIKNANNLTNNIISIGQVLNIPS